MANVLLTDYCNRNCSYCFARGKIDRAKGSTSKNGRHNIGMENLEKVLQLLERSRLKSFSALGGEPTLHPQFQEILERCLNRGFDIRLFTNGIINEDKLKYLVEIPEEKIKLIVNMNHPDESLQQDWKAALKTLEIIPDKAVLGFNIYRKDFQPDFLLDLIDRYKTIRHVRLGLSQPIYGVNNAYIPIEEYADISGAIVAFAKKCNTHDVTIGFDCGFIMCMFTEEQLGALYYSGCPFRFLCDPIIDIGPNLDVWHCFPLSTLMNTKLSNFNYRDEITKYYRKKTFAYKSVGAMEQCLECKYLKIGLCTGGCLSQIILSFKNGGANDEKEGNTYIRSEE